MLNWNLTDNAQSCIRNVPTEACASSKKCQVYLHRKLVIALSFLDRDGSHPARAHNATRTCIVCERECDWANERHEFLIKSNVTRLSSASLLTVVLIMLEQCSQKFQKCTVAQKKLFCKLKPNKIGNMKVSHEWNIILFRVHEHARFLFTASS